MAEPKVVRATHYVVHVHPLTESEKYQHFVCRACRWKPVNHPDMPTRIGPWPQHPWGGRGLLFTILGMPYLSSVSQTIASFTLSSHDEGCLEDSMCSGICSNNQVHSSQIALPLCLPAHEAHMWQQTEGPIPWLHAFKIWKKMIHRAQIPLKSYANYHPNEIYMCSVLWCNRYDLSYFLNVFSSCSSQAATEESYVSGASSCWQASTSSMEHPPSQRGPNHQLFHLADHESSVCGQNGSGDTKSQR